MQRKWIKMFVPFIVHYTNVTKKTTEVVIKNEQTSDTDNNGNKTKNEKKRSKNKIENSKMDNRDLAKNRRWIKVLAKDIQFLFLIRHRPCYLHIYVQLETSKCRSHYSFNLSVCSVIIIIWWLLFNMFWPISEIYIFYP